MAEPSPDAILQRLRELDIEARAEFAKQDLRARELRIPNEGWQRTEWIREEREPLVRALRASEGTT